MGCSTLLRFVLLVRCVRLGSACFAYPLDGGAYRHRCSLDPFPGLVERDAETSCWQPPERGIALAGHADERRKHPFFRAMLNPCANFA